METLYLAKFALQILGLSWVIIGVYCLLELYLPLDSRR
jgi:hypothetical protein